MSALRVVGAVAWSSLFLSVAACSSGDDDRAGPEPSVIYSFEANSAADEVCDGAITGEAARGLEALAGGTEFGEMDGLPPADLPIYAAQFAEPDAFTSVFCTIYTSQYSSNPFTVLRFSWYEREAGDNTPPEDAWVLYGTGDSAYVDVRADAAYIEFHCPVRDSAVYEELHAALTMPNPETATDPDAMMAVLNSVSSALADELGCPDDGLAAAPPERLPDV
ncbi:hypothetical protein ACL02R_08625 [Streptomyces sp. MS19]|uniref:hypothetical protein n=1 Tax=Streptomyces sp. MS19 TaxID=3385972 RepID=UPI0039A001C5